MFKADDYRLKTKALEGSLAETAEALDIAEQGARLAELKAEQEKPEVWQDLERSAKLAREAAAVEGKLNAYEKSKKAIEEVYALIDLIEEMGGGEEEADAALSGEIEELDRLIRDAETDLEDMRIRALLRGKYDGYNALLTLHSGAAAPKAATGSPCSTACTPATPSAAASR